MEQDNVGNMEQDNVGNMEQDNAGNMEQAMNVDGMSISDLCSDSAYSMSGEEDESGEEDDISDGIHDDEVESTISPHSLLEAILDEENECGTELEVVDGQDLDHLLGSPGLHTPMRPFQQR
jgi:hypothetical protein